WARIAGETHEHEAEQHLRAHRLQRELRTVPGWKGLARRHPEQLAAELVRPAVIRTGDGARAVARALEDARAAMAADVVEYLNLALRSAHRDDTVGAKIERDEVPGAREGADVAHDLPAGLEQPLVLESRHLRMIVDPRRQRARQGCGDGLERADGGRVHVGLSGKGPKCIRAYNSTAENYMII